MSELNAFFLKSDSVDVKEEGRCVDEDYVAALELYCLLKQCSLDMKHNWRTVMAVALASSTYAKYASKSCPKRVISHPSLPMFFQLSMRFLLGT